MEKEKLKELYLKSKFALLPVLAGLSFLIIIILVLVPHFLAYIDIRKQVSGTRSEMAFLEAKAEELQGINESVTQKNLQTVFTVLPSGQDVPQAMTALQNLVQRSGLQLMSAVYVASGVTSSTNTNSFGLNLTVSGPLEQFKNFLIYLRASPRIFQVQSVDIRFQRDSTNAEFEVPIRTFFSSEPGSIGSINRPLPRLTGEEESLLSRLAAAVGDTDVSVATTSAAVPLGKSDPFQ